MAQQGVANLTRALPKFQVFQRRGRGPAEERRHTHSHTLVMGQMGRVIAVMVSRHSSLLFLRAGLENTL